MLDLPEHLGLPLKNHKPIQASTEYFFPLADWEWYESDLEEILENLEYAYREQYIAKAMALEDSKWISTDRTWRVHVNQLKQWLRSGL